MEDGGGVPSGGGGAFADAPVGVNAVSVIHIDDADELKAGGVGGGEDVEHKQKSKRKPGVKVKKTEKYNNLNNII